MATKKKVIGILLCGAVACASLAIHATSVVYAEENAQVVYVSQNGSDTNVGSSLNPLKTMDKALEKAVDGGTIVVQDVASLSGWEKHGKSVEITGGTLEMMWSNDIVINDAVRFYDVSLQVNATANIFANGNAVTIGENVEWLNSPTIELHGGGMSSTTVASTDLTVLSGTYKSIFGGSQKGTVKGDTHLFVGGTVNADIDETNHAGEHFVFGGGNGDVIQGGANVTFGGNAKAVYLFGGSNNAGSKIANGSNLTVTGGKGMSVYAGNRNVDVGSGAKAVISGGTFEQVFGGNERASMTGSVDLRVLGGKITRRVYGGCYNDTSVLSFATKYYVSDEICLTIGDGAKIDFSSSEADRSIYARSRYGEDLESTQLVFAGNTAYDAYKNKLKAQDTSMKLFMGSLSAADFLHCYSYALSGNVITQTCVYHEGFSATATVCLDENRKEVYTGKAIEPVEINCDAAWEYDKPAVDYRNNVHGGVATCTVSIGDVALEKEFTIIEAPTVLGGSIRLSTPAGLRFQSKVPQAMVKMGGTFGTLLIPRAVLGENELTVETVSVENVVQTVWATNLVKENNPRLYEEGYEYFNAVLTDIPAEYYGEEIVARSYMYLDGVYYYSEEMVRSIAQVAAYALQDGRTESALYTYVDTALENETLGMEKEVILAESCRYTLSLSETKNCVAVWTVADESVVKVLKNGEIVALNVGETVVTATIGSRTLTCKIVVRGDVLDDSNELPQMPYLE